MFCYILIKLLIMDRRPLINTYIELYSSLIAELNKMLLENSNSYTVKTYLEHKIKDHEQFKNDLTRILINLPPEINHDEN